MTTPEAYPIAASASSVEAPTLPLLHAEDCPNGCGRPGRPGQSIFCSQACRDEMHARIDARFEAMMWGSAA